MIKPIQEADENCSNFEASFNQDAKQKQMLQQHEQYMAIHTEILKTVQSNEQYRREQELFSSFSLNYAMDKNFHVTRVQGTCRWLLNDPTFNR